MALFAVAPSKADGNQITAMELFDSPRIHDVATKNILTIGEHLVGKGMLGHRGPMRRLVESGFKNASLHLRKFHPVAAKAFDSTPLTGDHEDAIAHVMGYVSDERMTKLGLKIAHAVRDAKSSDPDVIKYHVARTLFHHMGELIHLNREMYPKGSPLRSLSKGGDLKYSLDKRTINLLKSANEDWDKLYPDEVDDE